MKDLTSTVTYLTNQIYASCDKTKSLSNSDQNHAFDIFDTDTNWSPHHNQHNEFSLHMFSQDNGPMASTILKKQTHLRNNLNENNNVSHKTLLEFDENTNQNQEEKTSLHHYAPKSQDLIQNEDRNYEHQHERVKNEEEHCESQQGSAEHDKIYLLSMNEAKVSQSSHQNRDTKFDPKDDHLHHQQQEQESRPYFKAPNLIQTRFDDIIGHEHAKLRLDEALLPLALPPSLALKILTGEFAQNILLQIL